MGVSYVLSLKSQLRITTQTNVEGFFNTFFYNDRENLILVILWLMHSQSVIFIHRDGSSQYILLSSTSADWWLWLLSNKAHTRGEPVSR